MSRRADVQVASRHRELGMCRREDGIDNHLGVEVVNRRERVLGVRERDEVERIFPRRASLCVCELAHR